MKNKSLIRDKNYNLILFNTILWLCCFMVLLFIFTKNGSPKKIDFIYTTSFLVTIIIPVLINHFIFIPRFLNREKYLIFIVVFILNIMVFTQLNIWFFDYIIDYLFPDFYFISYHSSTKLIIIFSIFLTATTLIKLSVDWFFFNKKENEEIKIKNQQIETQLSLIRSQINPHFLFNSLNVIYALTIEKKEETKNAIVQLSDILRYIIYDSHTKHIPLKKEITLLKNYIEFQKFRHQSSEKINFVYNINNDNFPIYPMLLLPLVENSFKYGMQGDLDTRFINIKLTQKNEKFTFDIENNYPENFAKEHNEYSGVGLKTIKKNLKIVYPKTHEFKIIETENTFGVTLNLF